MDEANRKVNSGKEEHVELKDKKIEKEFKMLRKGGCRIQTLGKYVKVNGHM